MKKILSLIFILATFSASANNFTPGFLEAKYRIIQHVNNDYQFQIAASYSFGSGGDCPKVVGYDVAQRHDTVFIRAYHGMCGVWATFFCGHVDTLSYTNAFTGVNFINISSNAIVCGQNFSSPNDTTFDSFDSTFKVNPNFVANPHLQHPPAVYPNPVSNFLTIDNSTGHLHAVMLTNIQGQIIYQTIVHGKKAVIPVNNYIPGLYLLRMQTTDGELFSQKIIVK